eukprot:CAMPEP_0202344942 /NCGR_PEP_ID=MMETSP1126-20121109/4398_1 /ASSEMBLY_ACC=CAM_ASM_000457 /TAXON_ID=3047 /ORGANISM="Dunaliella tertiolecta, Strain CCMP1320" /LENGTH=75 /DNA_ID=CAMNT_0048936185 /DNA_START=298 /DNA_END=525 /DNA_ORIENTATION=-
MSGTPGFSEQACFSPHLWQVRGSAEEAVEVEAVAHEATHNADETARIDVRKIMLEVCYPGTGYKGCKPQGHGTQQ